MAAALQLEGLVTKKPRVSKYTLKPQAVSLACTLLIMRANVSPSFSPRHRHRAFPPIVSTRRAEVRAFSLEPMDCSAFSIVISSTRIRKLTSTCRTILDWQVSAFDIPMNCCALRIIAYFSFSGTCDNSDESFVTLSFRGFVLSMYFEKTPGKHIAFVPQRKPITIHCNQRLTF